MKSENKKCETGPGLFFKKATFKTLKTEAITVTKEGQV
jgi:hypothetical protein